MSRPWVGWLSFAVLAMVVLASSCQAMGATVPGAVAVPAAAALPEARR